MTQTNRNTSFWPHPSMNRNDRKHNMWCMWLLSVFQVTFDSCLRHCPISNPLISLPGLKETKVYLWATKEITIITEYYIKVLMNLLPKARWVLWYSRLNLRTSIHWIHGWNNKKPGIWFQIVLEQVGESVGI